MMMSILKSNSDIRALKEAGRITQEVLQTLREKAQPGIGTVELEALAVKVLAKNRSSAPFRTFNGFNHATCISLNEEIVNGPPSRERLLQPGDIVSIATAAEHRGIHAKAAITFSIGNPVSDEIDRLLRGTALAIQNAVAQSQSVSTLNALLAVVPQTATQHGLSVIRDLGGAGIGKKLHEAPPVPNHPEALTETIPLQTGLCFTLMPMFCLGTSSDFMGSDFIMHEDGWTFVTRDKTPSAHFADTLLMTDEGLLSITRMAEEFLH
jgi:methionyl aminopeptidase